MTTQKTKKKTSKKTNEKTVKTQSVAKQKTAQKETVAVKKEAVVESVQSSETATQKIPLVTKEVVYNYTNGDMNTDFVNATNDPYRMEVSDIGSTDFTIYIGASSYSILSVVYITLQYTKTS